MLTNTMRPLGNRPVLMLQSGWKSGLRENVRRVLCDPSSPLMVYRSSWPVLELANRIRVLARGTSTNGDHTGSNSAMCGVSVSWVSSWPNSSTRYRSPNGSPSGNRANTTCEPPRSQAGEWSSEIPWVRRFLSRPPGFMVHRSNSSVRPVSNAMRPFPPLKLAATGGAANGWIRTVVAASTARARMGRIGPPPCGLPDADSLGSNVQWPFGLSVRGLQDERLVLAGVGRHAATHRPHRPARQRGHAEQLVANRRRVRAGDHLPRLAVPLQGECLEGGGEPAGPHVGARDR